MGIAPLVSAGTAPKVFTVGSDVVVAFVAPTKIASEVSKDPGITDNLGSETDEACTEPPIGVLVEGDSAVDTKRRLDCPVEAGGESVGTWSLWVEAGGKSVGT
jgi:hypothetical protein